MLWTSLIGQGFLGRNTKENNHGPTAFELTARVGKAVVMLVAPQDQSDRLRLRHDFILLMPV